MFKRNNVDRYIGRPNLTSSSGKFAVLDAFCYYYLPSNPKYVLQYYVPNKETKPEQYRCHMLFMHYRFRDEKKLLSGNPPTYASKLSEPNVIDLENQNYSLVEPFATSVDNAFLKLSSDIDNNMDLHGQQKNYELNAYLVEDIDDSKSEAFETMAEHLADIGINNEV